MKLRRLKIKGKRCRPKKHQRRAIVNAISHFEDTDVNRGILHHPSRSGKSYTAYWIKEGLGSKVTGIFTPSLHLVEDMLEKWYPNLKKSNVLCVGSDHTIARNVEKKYVSCNPPTTNLSDIVEFISESQGEILIVSTYASSIKIKRACELCPNFSFDFLVLDEAHRTVGVSSSFGRFRSRFVHQDSDIPATNRLYMTATLQVLSERDKLYAPESSFKASMDDPEIYGEVFDGMTFGDGIEERILSDYQISAVGIGDKEINSAINRASEDMDVKESAKLIALEEVLSVDLKDEDLTHVLSNHATVPQAQAFQRYFSLPDWETFHLNGTMPISERVEIIRKYEKSEKALLTNCKCLGEGVDIPVVDTIFHSDPKQSSIDIVQSTARCMTKDSNKPKGFINWVILPIFHEKKGEFLSADSAWRAIVNITRRMKSEQIEGVLKGQAKRAIGDCGDLSEIIHTINFPEELREALFLDLISTQKISDEVLDSLLTKYNGDRDKVMAEPILSEFGDAYLIQRISMSDLLRSKWKQYCSAEEIDRVLTECEAKAPDIKGIGSGGQSLRNNAIKKSASIELNKLGKGSYANIESVSSRISRDPFLKKKWGWLSKRELSNREVVAFLRETEDITLCAEHFGVDCNYLIRKMCEKRNKTYEKYYKQFDYLVVAHSPKWREHRRISDEDFFKLWDEAFEKHSSSKVKDSLSRNGGFYRDHQKIADELGFTRLQLKTRTSHAFKRCPELKAKWGKGGWRVIELRNEYIKKIDEAMKKHGGNRSKASKELGIRYAQLNARITEYKELSEWTARYTSDKEIDEALEKFKGDKTKTWKFFGHTTYNTINHRIRSSSFLNEKWGHLLDRWGKSGK